MIKKRIINFCEYIYYRIIWQRIIYLIRDFFSNINYKYGFKKHKYGFDVRDTWSLDCSFCEWVIPRLKHLKAHSHSYPGTLTEKEWDEILGSMIHGFELYLNTAKKECTFKNGELGELEQSLSLFKKWFRNLWD